MGKEVVKLVLQDDELELAAAVDRSAGDSDAGRMVGFEDSGVRVTSDLEAALAGAAADVLVDFTIPQSAYSNTALAIKYGVRPVIGTTGFTPEQIAELDKQCQDQEIGGLIAPNFSIGAILLMKFAAQAAKYFPHLEIIEYHGDQKLDAPSGTAIKTAEMISEARQELRQGHPGKKRLLRDRAAVTTTGSGFIAYVFPGFLPRRKWYSAGLDSRLRSAMIHTSVPGICRESRWESRR